MTNSTGSTRRKGQRRGLRNEGALRKRINRDADFRERLEMRTGMRILNVKKSNRGRLVSGATATAPTKADLVLCSDTAAGVSVKVSQEFEVDQRTVSSLSVNLEAVTGYAMPDEVRDALRLIVGDFGEDGWPGYLPIRGGGNNRPRLGAGDLQIYRPDLVPILEEWLTCGLPEITRFVFGCGATIDGHARYLWLYSGDDYDHIAHVENIVQCVESWVCAGNSVRIIPGMSTLPLPFGALTSASAAPNVTMRADFKKLKALGVKFL